MIYKRPIIQMSRQPEILFEDAAYLVKKYMTFYAVTEKETGNEYWCRI